MRYEDASGAFQASGPVANDDSDTLAAGSRGPATGNLITGEGTQYGSAGADTAAGAHVTAIAGKGGEDASFAGGKLSVTGEFGQLSVDAEGNYSYLANKGAPENVRDRFTYTLADNQGNSDTAALIVEIGKTPVVIKADAQQIVPGPDGVVTLPPGVELSDIMVVGRNLVVNMPDGTQLVIVDGAVFVPQLVLGGVEVPATNVAALLIGQEPQPAAGETPPSSGGNFALPPPPLDPGVPLGDLLPPTETNYIPPEPQETFLPEDNEPEIFVQPDGQPAAVAAVDQVEEAGLPERDGNLPDEPAGSGESSDGNGADNDVNSETTTGNIIYTSDDTPNVITINGVEVTAVGQVIHGDFGDLTITSIAPGIIGYSYTLLDNSSGNDTHDDFDVQLTDADGDIASATLRIDIIDDVPTARPDTDIVAVGETTATGNVMTDAAPGDVGDSDTNAADTVGADNASLTSVSGAGGSDSTFSEGVLTVNGQFGVLTIDAQGNYTYVRNPNSPGGVQDVFNYTLTDGDGDTSSSTLTITIPDAQPTLPDPAAVLLDDDALASGNPGGTDDDVDSDGTPGQLQGTGGDGDLDYAFAGANTLPEGFTVNVVNASTLQILQGGTVVLTVTLNNETGAYSVVQNAPIDHPAGLDENNLSFGIGVQVVDSDGDTDGATITINVDDDTPVALEAQVTGLVDEDGLSNGIAGGVDDLAGEATVATGSVATLFASGADTPLTYSLLTDTTGLPALTSGGVAISYAVNGNTLTASAGGSTVFTFTLNGDGSWTFTLVDTVDHAEGNNENDLGIALGSIIQATDADGDSVEAIASGLVITIDDDTPTAQDIVANQPAEDANVVFSIVGSIAGGADGVDLADVTFGAHNGSGSLSYDNGVFTYDPAPGEQGDVTFSYTIVDADGDSITKQVTIHLQPDSGPQVGTPENLVVDEDGFAFANDDANPLQSDPSETDHGENLTDSGNVVVDFGNDVPGAPLTDSIELLDGGALDGQLVDLDGNPVTFALNGSGQLVGTANGVTVMIIAISGAVAGPGAGEVTYSYSAQLLQPVQHADVGNTENSDLLSGVQFQVTDSDGDTAGGSFSVTVWDDVPSASDIEVNQPSQDANVVIDITGSIVEGADGVDLADVTFGAHSGSGNLSYNDNGVFTYDPAPGEEGDVSFTYTVVDGDGDEVTKTITIHLGEDSNPLVGPTENLIVDEDGLAGANVDNDPLQGNPGETNSTESATDSGQVTVSFGQDVPANLLNSIALLDSGALDGQLVDLDGNPVTFALVGGELVGTANGVEVMVISITNAVAGPGAGQVTYTYEAELLQPVQHADVGNNENTDLLSGVQFQVTDSDGDQATGSFNVTVVDDVPSIDVTQTNETGVTLTTQDAETDGNPTAQDTAVSTLNFSGVFGLNSTAGADGAPAPSLSYDLNVTAQNSGLMSHGQIINLFEVGGVIFGTTAGVAPVDANTPGVVFTLSVSNTGVVTLTQYQQVDHAVEATPVPGTDSPFDDQFATLVNGKITLTASSSITDDDGDTATDQEVVDLGGNIRFADDGPDAVNDSANQATENQPVVVNVFANDAPGADGVNVVGGITVVPDSLTGAGSLVYNNNGTFTYTPAAGEQGSITFQYQLTDFDGDTDIATVTINLQPDSTPSAVDSVASVDDDGLANGLPGSGAGDLDANAGEAATVNPSEAIWHGQLSATAGGDTIASFSFASMHGTSGSVGTETVNYSWDAGASKLTATIASGARAGTVLFDVVINQATGSYNLTLRENVLHADEVANQENDATTNLTFTVTDSDGDTDTGTIVVTFDDDMPQAIQPDAAVLENEIGSSITADLDDDGEVITDFGADGPGLVQFANITNNQDSGRTSGGDAIRYYLANDGQTLLAKTGAAADGTGGTLIFTVQINQADGDYTVTMAGTIDNGSGVTFSNLSDAAAGNLLFRGLGEDDASTPVDILLSASNPDGTAATVNTDADSIGAANQSTDQGETVRIDFVSNMVGGQATPTGFGYSGHVDTNSFEQTIPQVQGSQTETAAIRVYALDTADTQANEPDRNPAGGFDNTDIIEVTKVSIDGYNDGPDDGTPNEPKITVDISGAAVGDWTLVGYGVYVQKQSDGSVIFTGLQEGDRYGIETGSNDFNAIAVTTQPAGVGPNAANDSSTNSLDLGVFAIGQVETGDPIDLSFDLQITDADGDTVTMPGAIDITINPATESQTLAIESSSLTQQSAGDTSFTNLSFTNDNGKWDGHGNDKNFSLNNTGIVAGIVAASGLQSTAVAGTTTFEPSVDVGLQDTIAAIGLPAYQLESIDDGVLTIQSIGLESSQSALDVSALQGSSHSFSDFVDSGALDIQSYTDSATAYQPNFQADQAPTFDASMVLATVAPAIGMPSAEALVAAGVVGGVQQGGSVEQILADALGNQAPTVDGLLEAVNGGGEAISPTIEAALHALPGGGGAGDLSAVLNGASPDVGAVSGWDMHSAGSFGAGFDMMFKMDVATLHQDAVQPVING